MVENINNNIRQLTVLSSFRALSRGFGDINYRKIYYGLKEKDIYMKNYSGATSFFGISAILAGATGIYMLVIGLIETWRYFSTILTADQISVVLYFIYALMLPTIAILVAIGISRSMSNTWKDTVSIVMIFSGLLAFITFSIFPVLNI